MLIEVKNLHKSFGENQVLRGIDVSIQKGEVVVVIGPSGSGKSTFLRCLNLLEQPTDGQVIFDGVDLTDDHVNTLETCRRMGMVFQRFNLFSNLTILDNVTLAPMLVKKQSRAEAGNRWIVREARRLPRAAFRRTTAARSHCPRTGNGAGGHVV